MSLLQPFLSSSGVYAKAISDLEDDFRRDDAELDAEYWSAVREIDRKLQQIAKEAYLKYCGPDSTPEQQAEYLRVLHDAEAEARQTESQALQWLKEQREILATEYESMNKEAFRQYLGQVQSAWGGIDIGGLNEATFWEVNCLLPRFVQSGPA
ncbi:MAG: hypothetical protein P4L84_22630 [Isosphaeraceae bacterium]|nr:hypothetical protein [Isosphaeraceae bacterium]